MQRGLSICSCLHSLKGEEDFFSRLETHESVDGFLHYWCLRSLKDDEVFKTFNYCRRSPKNDGDFKTLLESMQYNFTVALDHVQVIRSFF